MIAFVSGLVAGSLHVISGPDHVAAVAPLATRAPESGKLLGALWGIGHGGGVLLWLLAATLFQRAFGQALPSEALEALVGVALLALGLFNLRGKRAHAHAHVHAHVHAGGSAAFAMGALHGSAGASHFLALLPALGLRGSGAILYASGYLLAGVLAMASVSVMLARLSSQLGDPRRLQQVCALGAAAIGAYWLVSSLYELA